jgi:hypothetical protein
MRASLLAFCALPLLSGATPDAGSGAATTVAFGPRGELVVDGKPRFVVAGYRSGQTDSFADALPSAAEAGFDMVHDYRFETWNLEREGLQEYIQEARRYLRRAEQHRLGVFLGIPRSLVRAGDEKAIGKIVAALASEPALWMWYVYDEPRPDVLAPAVAARVHGLLRRLDPRHPAILLSNRDETMRQYLAHCDVLWLDRYPVAATRAASDLMPIAQALDAARSAAGPAKPLWPVLQAHDNRGNPGLQKRVAAMKRPDDATHRPNESEVRAQAHVAIARGAMAVAYYWGPDSWYSMKDHTPRAWASLSRVVRELGSLESVLLSEPPAQPPTISRAPPTVLSWSRSHRGETWVGIVNADARKPVRVTVKSPAAARGFRKVQGDGDVSAANGGVAVRLPPAGVAVIEFGAP